LLLTAFSDEEEEAPVKEKSKSKKALDIKLSTPKVHIDLRRCTDAQMHAYTHALSHTHTYIHTYMHANTHIHTHTHTHAHILMLAPQASGKPRRLAGPLATATATGTAAVAAPSGDAFGDFAFDDADDGFGDFSAPASAAPSGGAPVSLNALLLITLLTLHIFLSLQILHIATTRSPSLSLT
jgi:hypothetical protein